jgi:hypothetical protein
MRVGCRKEREKKITQAVKTTPHIKQGKGAALVRGTIILLHQEKRIRKISIGIGRVAGLT